MKKIVFLALTLVMVLGLAGWGSITGYFQAVQVSQNNRFQAGVLDVTVDGVQYPNVWHFQTPTGGLQPGDKGVHTFVIENAGTLPGNLAIVVPAYTEDGGANPMPEMAAEQGIGNEPNLDDELLVVLWQDDNGNSVLDTGEQVLKDGVVSIILSKTEPTLVLVGYRLDPGDIKNLGFSWEVLNPADINKIMGDSVAFDVVFTLDQVVGTPAHFVLSNLVQPAEVWAGDLADIHADVANDGQQAGTVTVSGTIDGSTTDQAVALAGGELKTVHFLWTPAPPARTVDVDVSIPGQALPTCHIVVKVHPPRLQIGSEWVYETTYASTPPEVTVWTVVTAGIETVGGIECIHNTTTFNIPPVRKSSGVTVTVLAAETWRGRENLAQYKAIAQINMYGTILTTTMTDTNFVGTPDYFTVDATWSFDEHMALVPPLSGPTDTHYDVEVVGQEDVVVTAGTFLDCYKVEYSVSGSVTKTEWWSPDVKGYVKQISTGTYEFPETQELVSYSLVLAP